jgi:hypothetical protein
MAFAPAFNVRPSAAVVVPTVLTGKVAISSASMMMIVGDFGVGFPAPPSGLPIDFLTYIVYLFF